MIEHLTPEHFRPHLQKHFRVQGGRHALELVEVQTSAALDWLKQGLPRQPFCLIFKGPRGDVLHEGQYFFEVEDGVTFEFYVMPVHTVERDRQDYQAVFN